METFSETSHTILDKKGSRLFITLAPMGWNISLDELRIGRKFYLLSKAMLPMGGIEHYLHGHASQNGIGYIDLYSELKDFSHRSKKKLFLRADGHWSPTGHLIVAQAIFLAIKDQIPPKKIYPHS